MKKKPVYIVAMRTLPPTNFVSELTSYGTDLCIKLKEYKRTFCID